MPHISVLIPTFRRSLGFMRAARSVFAQTLTDIELIAIDNSPEGGALAMFEQLAREAPIPFRWAHAPNPGVAQARNAALALANGRYIAWLDDDEEAPAHWLATLLHTLEATRADCVFGPVKALAPQSRHRAYLEALYARAGPFQDQVVSATYGVGNSMQRRDFFANSAPFDLRADQTGGEDDRLFAAAKAQGKRFAWSAHGWVLEHVEAARLRVSHALKRAFAYGQGPSETAWAQRDFAALVRHMSIGAAQALIFGAVAGLASLARRPDAVRWLDRAVRGAGKVFWFCEQRFYGAALAKRQTA
ncbi:MAG TPA: glycosyltransferase family A protein [Caulobacterales bacterium]|nr:glycosyltransferase family A protein [Caulobacterales bacterium]